MSAVSDAFLKSVGPDKGNSKLGFHFSMEWDQVVLDDLYKEIGAGKFKNGFLFLLGNEMESLNESLKYWDFLFKEDCDRKVIGRNAYGSLLIVENENELGTIAPIGYLDVLNCKYYKDANLDFLGLIGNWIPKNRLEYFLDDHVYNDFLIKQKIELSKNEILAIKVPLSLGGKMNLDNFQIEDIDEYFKSITEIYKKAI